MEGMVPSVGDLHQMLSLPVPANTPICLLGLTGPKRSPFTASEDVNIMER